MRVTEITSTGSRWSPLALHPRLTVVAGDADQRAEVLEVLSTIFSSAGSGISGTLEYAGLHMPLDQTSVVSLDIQGRGLPVVDPEKWQGTLKAMRSELDVEVEARLVALDATSEHLESEVDALERRAAASDAAIAAVSEELSAGNQLLEELTGRLEAALRRPEELRAELEEARSDSRLAEADLSNAQQLVPSLLETLDVSGHEVTALRFGQEPVALIEAIERAEASRLVGSEEASVLLAWLGEVAAGTAEPSKQISAMLTEIRHLEELWEAMTARGVEDEPSVVEARLRHEEASARARSLDQLAGSGLLADRARSEIDAAHDSSDPAEEQRVLALYGFDSYLEYKIALSTRSVGDAIEATIERSRADLVRATDALELARESAAAERDDLNCRRDDLRERIRTTTGVEPEGLSEAILTVIPEIPPELGELPASFEAALRELTRAVGSTDQAVAAIESELDELDDPQDISRELDEQRSRVERLEELSGKAGEVGNLTRDALGDLRARLAQLEVERRELRVDANPPGTYVSAFSTTEVALAIRALGEQLSDTGTEAMPVLMADTFSAFDDAGPQVLEALGSEHPGLQVVYITGSEPVSTWARRLKADTGRLVRLGNRTWIGRRLARAHGRRSREERPVL